MKKKGLSNVVAAMILILMVVAGTGIIWVSVHKTVNEDLGKAKACYDVIGKVEFNSEYTCYNTSSNEMRFSIGVGDINFEEMDVAISYEDSSVKFILSDSLQTIENLRGYDGSVQVKLPDANSGFTYVASGINKMPLSLEVAPIINGESCGASDTFADVYLCS